MPTASDAVEQHITEIGAKWARNWNAGNLDKLVHAYALDAVYMPPHHATIHGRDAIHEFLKAPMQHGLGQLSYEVTFVKHSGELAYDVGSYSMTGKREDRGKYLTVWRRQSNGEWLIVADTWSSDLPANA